MENGIILYDGPSQIDGKPIVVILTGLVRGSANPKTGTMLQTWILRKDVHPMDAMVTGEDESICGDCIHRPKKHEDGTFTRSCYVLPFGPNGVWEAFHRGIYVPYQPARHNRLMRRAIRFGSYGDPAAAPYSLWSKLARLATRRTGYTHAWRYCDQRFAKLVMASCEHESDANEASSKGWRTFRVKMADDRTMANEIVCPASKEAGQKRTCLSCAACKGSGNGRNVVIDVHGRQGHVEAFQLAIGQRARISLNLV